MSTTSILETGRGKSGIFREAWAGPIADKVFFCNGWDVGKFYHLKTGAVYEIGIDPPPAPTLSEATSGFDRNGKKQVGTYRYRLRLWDSKTQTMSLPSPSASITNASAKRVRVTFPSTPSGRVGDYWIVERTTSNGQVFFPVNRIARAQITAPGTITVTNGSRDVVGSGTNWTTVAPYAPSGGNLDYPIGNYLFVGTEDVGYLIQSVTDDTHMTLKSSPGLAYNGAFDGIAGTAYKIYDSLGSENGTPVGTVFWDDVSPSDPRARFLQTIDEVQAKPPAFPLCWGNEGRLFMAGAVEYVPYTYGLTVSATNGSKIVTADAAAFSEVFDGNEYTGAVWGVDLDGDGKVWPIETYTDSTHLILRDAYTGSTGAKTAARFAPPGNLLVYSEQDEPESCGTAEFVGVSNQFFVGDSGRITAGVGMGRSGGTARCVIAKKDSLHVLTYSADPGYLGGGRLAAAATRRGALGSRSLLAVDGVAYGMDSQGCWMMEPGGEPMEIGVQLRADWRNHLLNFTYAEEFWIQHEPETQTILFWVVEAGETAASVAFVWSIQERRFTGTRRYCAAHTAGCTVVDLEGRMRAASFSEHVSAAKFNTTSSTSFEVGTGSKTFTVPSGLGFGENAALRIESAANSANFMLGTVTSYSGTSLEVDVTSSGGSGTHTDWVIGVVGTNLNARLWAHNIGLSDGVYGLSVLGGNQNLTTIEPQGNGVYWCGAGGVSWGSPNDPAGVSLAVIGDELQLLTGVLLKLDDFTSSGNTLLRACAVGVGSFVAGGAIQPVGIIGGIAWKVWTGRIDAGQKERKKNFIALWLRLRPKTMLSGGALPALYLKAYGDGNAARANPSVDHDTIDEQGVTQYQGVAAVKGQVQAPDGLGMRFMFPLNNLTGVDVQFQLYGMGGDVPIEIMGPMELVYSVEGRAKPTQ